MVGVPPSGAELLKRALMGGAARRAWRQAWWSEGRHTSQKKEGFSLIWNTCDAGFPHWPDSAVLRQSPDPPIGSLGNATCHE